jgi:hypothetical protein
MSSFLQGLTGLRINEIMASSVRAYPDITDIEDDSDWIELHQAGAQKEKENLHEGCASSPAWIAQSSSFPLLFKASR